MPRSRRSVSIPIRAVVVVVVVVCEGLTGVAQLTTSGRGMRTRPLHVLTQANGPLTVAGVLSPVCLRVLRAVGLCAASPAVEAARTHLAVSVTCWCCRGLV